MSGSGSGLEKIMDPHPVCPERLEPNPKPWLPPPAAKIVFANFPSTQQYLNRETKFSEFNELTVISESNL